MGFPPPSVFSSSRRGWAPGGFSSWPPGHCLARPGDLRGATWGAGTWLEDECPCSSPDPPGLAVVQNVPRAQARTRAGQTPAGFTTVRGGWLDEGPWWATLEEQTSSAEVMQGPP